MKETLEPLTVAKYATAQVVRSKSSGVRSIDVKEKYIKPTRVFELEDGVGIYRNRRR